MVNPTFSLIKVKNIENNCYILENGGLRSVVETSGVNFSLFSENEQEVIIGQFKNFLDSLDFSIEILILSRLENIDNYLKVLHYKLEQEKDPLIKIQLEEYISFLEDYLENHKIMKKIFYIVIPYDTNEINFGNIKRSKNKVNEESYQLKLEQLEMRTNYIIENMNEIGLLTHRLNNQELTELLFELYNPNLKWSQIPKDLIKKLVETL